MLKLALLGSNVTHSLSPLVYESFFTRCNERYQYNIFNLSENELYEQVSSLITLGYDGFNITNPHKFSICKLVSDRAAKVTKVGCANVVKIDMHGNTFAANTDGIGFIRHLKSLELPLINNVLILGSGGVVPAILSELLAADIKVDITVRNMQRAAAVLSSFSGIGLLSLRKDYNLNMTYDLIINASGVCLKDFIPFIPNGVLKKANTYYDLAYSKAATYSVDFALKSGCKYALNGVGMLVYQAAYAIEVWTGNLPSSFDIASTLLGLEDFYVCNL
ncbi:MAG: hypothetical protein VX335_00445 [Pseudomonadota bacterium]|nr:hypothetical protein [Pseudomonadota bacterium]